MGGGSFSVRFRGRFVNRLIRRREAPEDVASFLGRGAAQWVPTGLNCRIELRVAYDVGTTLGGTPTGQFVVVANPRLGGVVTMFPL